MLKTHQKSLVVLHKLVDLVIVFVSWQLAYYFRFELGIPGASLGLEWWYAKLGILLVVLNYYFFRRESLYTSKRFSPFYKEMLAVFKASSMSLVAFVVVVYFFSSFRVSRLTLFTYFLLSSSALLIFKFSMRSFLRKIRLEGRNLRKVILIGNGVPLKNYEDNLVKHPELGLEIIGRFENANKEEILELSPDIIVIGYDADHSHESEKLIKEIVLTGIQIIYLPDLSFSLIGHDIIDLQGIPAISVNETQMSSTGAIVKRLMDIILTGVGMVVISPLLFLLAILVKLSSKGPIFYGQVRMGLDGREFKMWKFRSMRSDSSNHQGWTVKDDPRVTPIGKILRKTSLDELPQLWNVFVGEMSLVGPRPERPQYVEEFRKKIPTYMLRHKMKAGITGWAQINGWRGDTSIEKRIECDLYYIRNWSLWMDFSIIFLTFWKGFFNKNAY